MEHNTFVSFSTIAFFSKINKRLAKFLIMEAQSPFNGFSNLYIIAYNQHAFDLVNFVVSNHFTCRLNNLYIDDGFNNIIIDINGGTPFLPFVDYK